MNTPLTISQHSGSSSALAVPWSPVGHGWVPQPMGAGEAKPGPWARHCPVLPHTHTRAAPQHRLDPRTALAIPATAPGSTRTSGHVPSPRPAAQAAPQHASPAWVTALLHSLQQGMQTGQAPTNTRSGALPCRHLAQPAQGAGTKQGSAASLVPAGGQAASESPRHPERL